MEWSDDDLTCFTFCQISLSISLRHRREPRRRKGGKKDFLEKSFEICELAAILTCPHFSLSLSSRTLFFLCVVSLPFAKKKRFFFS